MCEPATADVNAADHDVAFLLGIDHRFVHALHRRLEIDDLAFAHAARRRLADSENLDRAVGPAFADDDTNFRGADFETDHQITACHFVILLSVEPNVALPCALGGAGFRMSFTWAADFFASTEECSIWFRG